MQNAPNKPGRLIKGDYCFLEARPGVEPGWTDLQSVA